MNNKTLTATACSDPYNYVSWDGIHATEAANKLVTLAILNGSYSDPPFSFQNLCDLQPLDWPNRSSIKLFDVNQLDVPVLGIRSTIL